MHDGVAVGACCAGVARLWDFEFLAQGGFELFADVLVLLQEDTGVFAALAHARAAEADPRAALFQHALFNTQIDQVAFARDAFAVDDIEFGFAERRSDFVLHHLRARSGAHDLIAFLDGLYAPDIHAHGRIELQRAAARRRFRVAEHDANFLADLVDENQAGAGFRNDAGELAQRLRHQPRLQTHLRVAHVALKFGLGN